MLGITRDKREWEGVREKEKKREREGKSGRKRHGVKARERVRGCKDNVANT